MDLIERMERYADSIPQAAVKRYDMYSDEILALRDTMLHSGDIAGMFFLAFRFGRAKGYRAAMAWARKGGQS